MPQAQTDVQNLRFSLNDNWRKLLAEADGEENRFNFIPEFAEDENEQEFVRKRGGEIVYKLIGEKYVCCTCGSKILGGIIRKPIWDSPFGDCSGEGRCDSEIVPYCPKCEKDPSRF